MQGVRRAVLQMCVPDVLQSLGFARTLLEGGYFRVLQTTNAGPSVR